MKYGIVGLGTVGNTILRWLKESNRQVTTYDPKYGSQLSHILATDCVFVCVPTDTKIDGRCDTSAVENTIAYLSENNYQGLIIIKSTVIPGTTQQLINNHNLRIVFVPEFLRDAHAFEDFSQKQILIIGTNSNTEYETVCKIYKNIAKDSKKVTPTEAEIIKYFSNNFNALRVVFANLFYDLCQHFSADYTQILTSMESGLLDLHGNYLQCDYSLRGYSGKCLPKDVRALATLCSDIGLHYKLLQTVEQDNDNCNT